MALFSKPPAKKPEPPKGERKVRGIGTATRPASTRHGAHGAAKSRHDKRTPAHKPGTQPASSQRARDNVIEWLPAQPVLETTSATPMCGVLENAALLFASGQAGPARVRLEDGVANDPEALKSDLAWLALFDLLQRAGDRSGFDQLALRYVVNFEQSAPGWETVDIPVPGKRTAPIGGYIALSGELSAASAMQIEGVKRIGAKQARLDLSTITGFDSAGARLLADALGTVRRQRAPLSLERVERLRPLLEKAVREGRRGGEGAWLLLLELLQWQGDQAAFDDRAVEYAVTFEMSPPSWEPPASAGPAGPAAQAGNGSTAEDLDAIAWSGEVTGASPRALTTVLEVAQSRTTMLLDLANLERIDFAAAAALVNAVNRLATQRKTLQIAGATAIVRALLFLVGLPPAHFVKNAV